MREQRGFGYAGRPTGEEDRARVLRVTDSRKWCSRGALEPVGDGGDDTDAQRVGDRPRAVYVAWMRDDNARSEVLDGGGRLAFGETGIDRRERRRVSTLRNRARARRGRWVPPHHPVEGRHPFARQSVRGLVGTAVEVAEGSPVVTERRTTLRRRETGGVREKVVDPDVHV